MQFHHPAARWRPSAGVRVEQVPACGSRGVAGGGAGAVLFSDPWSEQPFGREAEDARRDRRENERAARSSPEHGWSGPVTL